MDHRRRAFSSAFSATLPILAGFMFTGMAYGIYMNVSGFNFLYPLSMSLAIFAGSLQFVVVGLLLGPFEPLKVLLITLMLNARHLFYGISMLEMYSGTGLIKPYLIFGMCDETFSINYASGLLGLPDDIDKKYFMFFVTLLNHIYWTVFSALGGLFGTLVRFDTEGLEFVMTALFVVIFVENWTKEKAHYGSMLGLGLSALGLTLFGRDNFMIPSMLMILCMLTLLRKAFQASGAYR